MATVLIIDRNRIHRLLLAEELSLRGYVTVTARDGAQAVTALSHVPMDLVVLSLPLPDAGDPRLVERLSGRLARVPVVALGSAAAVPAGVLSGVVDVFVADRSSVTELLRVVARLLRRTPPDAGPIPAAVFA